MRRSKKKVIKRRKRPACGLCGSRTDLTRTECCGQWICDDADQYVAFSYARNSCYRNHDRYTLCAYHYNEGHEGDWKDCRQCREDFSDNLEMYCDYGTNEYNFEILSDLPAYEPTYCSQCGERIIMANGGYSIKGDTYTCQDCDSEPMDRLKSMATVYENDDVKHEDFEDDIPCRLGVNDSDDLPEQMFPRFEDIARFINGFCADYEAFEFGILCMDMNLSLCVQFPGLLSRGKAESWAAGIVHAMAMVNFLSDPSFEPYIPSAAITSFFEVSKGTIQSKSKQIRDLFDTFPMDPVWSLPELLIDNPMLWMVPIDGIMMDIRQAPLKTQQKAVQLGLIPMLPETMKQKITEYKQEFASELKSRVPQPPLAEPAEEDGHRPNIKIIDYIEKKPAPRETLPLFDPPEKK